MSVYKHDLCLSAKYRGLCYKSNIKLKQSEIKLNK
jgi:hypothetical protein